MSAKDFERFALLLAMDNANLAALRAQAPVHRHQRMQLFLDYAPESGHREVPDPYYGGPAGFEQVLDLAKQAARGLLVAIRSAQRRL